LLGKREKKRPVRARKGNKGKKGKKEGGSKMENTSEYGHRKMIVWKNLDKMEEMIQKEILKHIPYNCFQLRDQIERASSSCTANFIEGYYSGSIKEYIKFLKYSKRSLAELQDWIRRIFRKNFISENLYLTFDRISIQTMFLQNRLINALELKVSRGNHPKPFSPL